MGNIYRNTEYVMSAHNLSQLPPDDKGREIAFAGRSNAGKSSAINVICEHRNLARTSKTPGRTQQINFFRIDDERYLVDLPGYGFAKVPQAVKKHWQQTLSLYLQQRRCLGGLILLMDIRHPLKEYDSHMLQWSINAKMPVHVLLTKADKLSRGKAMGVLQQTQSTLKKQSAQFSIQLFSALKRDGLEEARAQLDKWFSLNTETIIT